MLASGGEQAVRTLVTQLAKPGKIYSSSDAATSDVSAGILAGGDG